MPNRIGAKLADLLDHLGDFRAFQRPFLILLAVFSIFYFSELANFSLSIDDELAAMRGDAAIWAAQGRWLSYLVEQFLISQPVLPFFPLFIFGALVCAGYIILVNAHGYQAGDPRLVLVFCLFCAFPTLFFILDFAGNTASLGLGILASCVCVFVFDKALLAYLSGGMKRRHHVGLFALQVGLGAAAIGAYQSLVLLVAAGCCGLFILRYLRGPTMSWREVALIHAYLICSVLASVALNFLISRGFQWGLAIEPAYIGQLVQVDLLIESPASVFKAMVKEYWQIYGGKRAVYGFRYITFPALILLGLFSLAAGIPGRAGPRLLFAFVYLFGITTIPFAMNVITGGDAPYRALVAVPYVFWFLAAGAVLSSNRIIRRLAVVLVVIVTI